HPRDRRVRPDWRERSGPEAGRGGRGERRARRPCRPCLHEHPGDAGRGTRVAVAVRTPQVTRGAGTILVTSTGMSTEVGHISGMLNVTKDEVTPLTRQLNALTNQILVIAGVALLISIGIGLGRNTPIDELFLTAIAFAVSAIPTGLPAVVTAILSRGTTPLADAGAIVKRLRSVETLGSTSAINSDKTGTLTLN